MMMKLMACSGIAAALALAGASATAQQIDTLKKIKDSGSISLGVRESSGLSYTIGNGKFVGFHTEMAERIRQDPGSAGAELPVRCLSSHLTDPPEHGARRPGQARRPRYPS